jgi:hypothetical protein
VSLTELLLNAPILMQVVAGVLFLLLLAFLVFFLAPAIRLAWRLGAVWRALRQSPSTSPKELEKTFERDRELKHLWREFRDTLHAQKEERNGQLVIVDYRATAPAESFFNSQNVVDGRLRTEFFKHLPGIFTGIGIIGTFAGLISGLQSFEVPDDPARVRASLELLLEGVFEAFVVSASAIGLAMLVTICEKLFLASLYRRTEAIAQHLDGLFATGAGEEYLARLVSASEDSAAQAKILKDALVGELKVILQELTDRQIAAHHVATQELGKSIADGIREGLEDPLTKIGSVVEKASGDQSAAAAALLKDVMASFSQRINELFGGQISGIQELTQKSAQEMQQAVAALQALVGQMGENARRSGDEMAERMAAAIEDMERRQAAINEQSLGMLETMRDLMAKSQTEVQDKLRGALSDLSEKVVDLISSLQKEAQAAREEQRERENFHAEGTRSMVKGMSVSTERIMESVQQCIEQMRTTVATLERTTITAIDKMNVGAGRLETGAQAFADAGGRITKAMEQTTTVAGKMVEVSGALTSSSVTLKEALADYRENRQATTTMVTELRAIVEAAKREAALTREALDAIQTAARQLAEVQGQAKDYLGGISEVLMESHDAFADGLVKVLDRANSEFHTKLSTAVGLLGDAVQELAVTLDGAIPNR